MRYGHLKFSLRPHLHIAVREFRNLTCEMLSGTAMVNLGEAEPIRIRLSCAVFEIIDETRQKREVLTFFARIFAVIG